MDIEGEPERGNVIETQNPNRYVHGFVPGIGLRWRAGGGNCHADAYPSATHANADTNAAYAQLDTLSYTFAGTLY